MIQLMSHSPGETIMGFLGKTTPLSILILSTPTDTEYDTPGSRTKII